MNRRDRVVGDIHLFAPGRVGSSPGARRRRRLSWAVLFAVGLLSGGSAAVAETIVLRSGTNLGVPGTPGVFGGPNDDNLTYFTGTACCVPLSPVAFTPADFAAARTGPSAILVWGQIPPWVASLPCDSDARWIWTGQGVSHSGGRPPYSTLFAYPFNVITPSATTASVSMCWAADESLGDPSGPNPIGVYVGGPGVAGVALPATFSGGGFGAQTTAVAPSVAVTTGLNWLYIYVRDLGGSVAGLNFSCTIEIDSGDPGVVGCCADTGCPCGNNGATCNGCGNSINPAGASLTATGLPFSEVAPGLGPDTVSFAVAGLPNTTTGVLFKSTISIPPVIFGDGLRCCGGALSRLGVQAAVAGTFAFPAAGQPVISVRGMSPPGETACYQVYYRDPDPFFCTSASFNSTNSYVISWL